MMWETSLVMVATSLVMVATPEPSPSFDSSSSMQLLKVIMDDPRTEFLLTPAVKNVWPTNWHGLVLETLERLKDISYVGVFLVNIHWKPNQNFEWKTINVKAELDYFEKIQGAHFDKSVQLVNGTAATIAAARKHIKSWHSINKCQLGKEWMGIMNGGKVI